MIHLRALEAARHALHDLLEVEPALSMEYRRVADLRVHDPVAREILAAFVRDALERLLCLHDRDRVRESAKIERERTRRGARVEPPAQLLRVRRRQPFVPLIASELDDRHGPQPAVEMVVQEHFRRGAERLEGNHGRPERYASLCVRRACGMKKPLLIPRPRA